MPKPTRQLWGVTLSSQSTMEHIWKKKKGSLRSFGTRTPWLVQRHAYVSLLYIDARRGNRSVGNRAATLAQWQYSPCRPASTLKVGTRSIIKKVGYIKQGHDAASSTAWSIIGLQSTSGSQLGSEQQLAETAEAVELVRARRKVWAMLTAWAYSNCCGFDMPMLQKSPSRRNIKLWEKNGKARARLEGNAGHFYLDYVPCVSVCLKNQFIATRSIMAQWHQVFLVIVFFPTKLIYLPAWQRGCSIKHSPRIIYGIMLIIRWIL